MTVALLEMKLNSIFHRLPTIRILMPNLLSENDPINRISREFDGLIPLPPINVRHGFRYSDNQGIVSLKLFRYSGVGRYILYKLSELYEVIDGHKGAHCVLLSGTSFAPGSPRYNIDIPVSYLLKPQNETEQKISYSFMDVFSEKISGVSDPAEKKKAYRNLVERLSEKDELFGSGKSQINRIFDELDGNRRRILKIVGSYEDAEYVSSIFNAYNTEQKSLALDSGNDFEDENANFISRTKVHTFAYQDKQVLVAPLMSMERGHNILTDLVDELDESFNKSKVAAFGAAIFLCRPYYVPDDFGLLINRINSWYMSAIKEYPQGDKQITLKEEVKKLVNTSYKELDIFNRASLGYETLEDEERRRLLTDTFVNTWQLEGRLIRGGMDANVYFADSSFAPNTKSGVDNDSIKTSMLLGWKHLWREILDNPFDDLNKTLLRELYSIRLDGLKIINVAE